MSSQCSDVLWYAWWASDRLPRHEFSMYYLRLWGSREWMVSALNPSPLVVSSVEEATFQVFQVFHAEVLKWSAIIGDCRKKHPWLLVSEYVCWLPLWILSMNSSCLVWTGKIQIEMSENRIITIMHYHNEVFSRYRALQIKMCNEAAKVRQQ